MKYKFTGEAKNCWLNVAVRRIVAVKDFGDVKKGDVGGWIESEKNLSQTGESWIYDDAIVCNNAEVNGDAKVYENATVFGNADVYGNAKVYGNAQVFGNSIIFENAQIYEDAHVFTESIVHGNAEIYGKCSLNGSNIYYGNAKLCGRFSGHSGGNIGGYALIKSNSDSFYVASKFVFSSYLDKDGEISCNIFIKDESFDGKLDDFKTNLVDNLESGKDKDFLMSVIDLAKLKLRK